MTRSLRDGLPSPGLEILLAVTSVVCGAIVGAERERHEKPAGLRTLTLVCLGSTVFTLMSFLFISSSGDSGRVAGQIVTGIGFLGAGAILHSRNGVSGMTTAATIWVTAAIGMVVGAGFALAGFGLSLLVRIVLVLLLKWEMHHLGGVQSVGIELKFDPDHGKVRIKIERLREDFRLSDQALIYANLPDGTVRAQLDLRLPRRHLHEFLDALASLHGVIAIHERGQQPLAEHLQ
ncbi:MAG: MgtC/SapB family protein [Verrucomicrobia bacterium]|nr:MAG: MgtC/SapB family protein [Verrucomicrobiota bacterium]